LRQVCGLPAKPQTADQVQAMSYMGIDPAGMREMVADYYNCISRLDSLIGDLLAELEESGKAKNTIVIYLGDHGADMLRGKRTCYEGGLRIPLLIRWPVKIAAQVRHELVSTTDLMPTVLAAAGVQPPPRLPGRDLKPLFTQGKVDWRTHCFAEYHTHAVAPNYFPQRSVRTDRFKLIENLLPGEIHPDYDNTLSKLEKEAKRREIAGGLDLPSVIAQAAPEVRSAYGRMREPPQYELYDLQADPYEFINLADSAEHAGVLKELQTLLKQWRQETHDPLLSPEHLKRLSTEVRSIKKKDAASEYHWGYPDYFFGRQPSTAPPTKKKKKQQANNNE
ncbi:MAG TPA: hypothetical protein DCF63_19570, partial [Planctomycetaceae bacterium]|nr:hypothetical protein [Planctomycetaceae bacterium]